MAIVSTYQRWSVAARHWRAWLRLNAWYVALLLVLGVGLVEPIGCFLQCQFWLHTGSASGAQHAHHHGAPGPALAEPRTGTVSPVQASSLAAIDPCVGVDGPYRPFNAPERSALALAHEHLGTIIVVVLLALILRAEYAVAAPRHAHPRRAIRPPLRPPIPLLFAY